MIPLFVQIGFLPITLWDILDVLIVGYLIYYLYRLLKGSIAVNIFVALIVIFVVSGIVKQLEMTMLSRIMSAVTNVGLIAVLIVFQPEVRGFLTALGRGTLKGRLNFWNRLVNNSLQTNSQKEQHIHDIIRAAEIFSKYKVGALIVFTTNPDMEIFQQSGVVVNGEISTPLLESIFNKHSPLHDGAVIISGGIIKRASTILPVSEQKNIPKSLGLRHRAALGITEGTEAIALIISEQNGKISIARNGKINRGLTSDQLDKYLRKVFGETSDLET